MNSILRNSMVFLVIIALQIALLFYFRPTMIYTPYIYLLLLFRIDKSHSQIWTLFSAFFLGLLIDILLNSWGIHTFFAVLIAFLLPSFVNIFSEQGLSEDSRFSVTSMGSIRYTLVLFILLFIYHCGVLLLWNFSLDNILYTLYKGLISTLIATTLILLIQNLFSTKIEDTNE